MASHAVVLTFPGHFFQTVLTTRSMLCNYPEIAKITFVVDDIDISAWPTYVADFAKTIRRETVLPIDIICTSKIDTIKSCVSGWWRQQLIKLTLDRMLPDQEWFVVDGDVFFESRCECKNTVPFSMRQTETHGWDIMVKNYVRALLGTDLGGLHYRDQPVVTSPVPFRYVQRNILEKLRLHVQERFNQEFVACHLSWFDQQIIVAHIDPPDRWVMSEWELIECFRLYVLNLDTPMVEFGSGYSHDCSIHHMPVKNLFRHAYKRDSEIGLEWLTAALKSIDQDIWQKSQTWYRSQDWTRPNG